MGIVPCVIPICHGCQLPALSPGVGPRTIVGKIAATVVRERISIRNKETTESSPCPFNHIAVVPSLDVAQNLRDLAFSQFIVVDSNGGVLGIYDND
jgi:hypothetical protein